ncbi:MAG: polyphenol oxidase family protein [Planctomycetota bacterium]
MKQVDRDGNRLLVFPSLERIGLTCAISTKPLDVKIESDRARFLLAAGLDPARSVTPRQMHRADVLDVRAPLETPAAVDALITDVPGLALCLRAADCSLVVVADPENRTVGVAHAGWKGSARGVVIKLVRALNQKYGSDPANCFGAIGPTISQAHYPVGTDVPAAFLRFREWASRYVKMMDGRLHFDLAGANAECLAEAGLPREHIAVSPYCTYGSPEILHSYRRDSTGAGHHGLCAAWV